MSKLLAKEESLYGRVLIWAYNRGAEGFTWEQLGDALKLSAEKLEWVRHTLHERALTVESIFERLEKGQDGVSRYSISMRGTVAAVEYLHLREVEQGGKRAQMIAVVSILIGAVVGLAQVFVALTYPSHANPSSTASPSAPS